MENLCIFGNETQELARIIRETSHCDYKVINGLNIRNAEEKTENAICLIMLRTISLLMVQKNRFFVRF